ncbi:hypothetical protein HYX07_05215 [Candidatus Woesearchaeota archaeon]|nr:hypothetical protein [Candidatus Woesearchaeota archaeon]
MGDVTDYIDKVKRFYKYTPYEIRGLVISILVIAFIISFKEWGTKNFDLAIGMFNLFNSILIVALSILVHDTGQRLWGLTMGYRVEFKMWTFGLVAALLIAFVSNGNLWLIVPAGFMIHHLAGPRLGWFRYGLNYFGQAMIALAGPLFSLMLIILFKLLGVFSSNPLIEKAIIFNVIYAITCLLPIPPLDGSKIYFGSRMLYAFSLPAIVVSAILMITNVPIFLALVISFLIGITLWLVYYISFENRAYLGPK